VENEVAILGEDLPNMINVVEVLVRRKSGDPNNNLRSTGIIFCFNLVPVPTIDLNLMHNDVTRLDAHEECWS
jgi:hypothetical protein